jgi:hypothetical protein
MRFSIARLMGGIAVLAVGLFMFRSPSRIGAALLFSGALAVLTAALAGILYCTGRCRAYWSGFCLGGWLYLLLSLLSPSAATTRPYLITTPILHLGQEGLIARQPSLPTNNRTTPPSRWDVWTDPGSEGTDYVQAKGWGMPLSSEYLIWTGHSLFSLLAALVAGTVFRHIRDSCDRPNVTSETPSSRDYQTLPSL